MHCRGEYGIKREENPIRARAQTAVSSAASMGGYGITNIGGKPHEYKGTKSAAAAGYLYSRW